MPTLEKRVSPVTNEVSWRAKVRVKGYPPQYATFKDKTAAKHWANRTEADLREDKYFPSNKSKKHTVAELIDLYLDHLKGKNPRRYTEVKPLLEWWKSELGQKVLAGFRSEEVLRGQQKLMRRTSRKKKDGGTLSHSTVNRYMVALHTAVQFGIKPLKWINTNVVSDVAKLEEPPGRVRYLSPDEINRLLAACRASKNRHLFSLALVGLSTGARRNEIRFMKWADVSPGCLLITLPKTKNKKIRSVSLTGVALALVRKMHDDKKEGQIFLFPSPHDPNRPIDFESAWRYAIRTAEILGFCFHDLRHTHASYLAMNGASTLVIKDALGQKTAEMAHRYAHLAPGHTFDIVGQMTEKVLGHVEI